jgi:hypothetical protein
VILAEKDGKQSVGGFVIPNDVLDHQPLESFAVPIDGNL